MHCCSTLYSYRLDQNGHFITKTFVRDAEASAAPACDAGPGCTHAGAGARGDSETLLPQPTGPPVTAATTAAPSPFPQSFRTCGCAISCVNWERNRTPNRWARAFAARPASFACSKQCSALTKTNWRFRGRGCPRRPPGSRGRPAPTRRPTFTTPLVDRHLQRLHLAHPLSDGQGLVVARRRASGGGGAPSAEGLASNGRLGFYEQKTVDVPRDCRVQKLELPLHFGEIERVVQVIPPLESRQRNRTKSHF
jgi:hypothetical protein